MITELLEICFIVKRDEPQMLGSIKKNLKISEKKDAFLKLYGGKIWQQHNGASIHCGI